MKFVDVKNDIAFRKIFGNEKRLRSSFDGDKHSWKKEELIEYDNASIAEQDERGKLIAAENKGKQEGKLAEKEAVIKRCWNEKMRLETIATITNLTVAEVQKVIEK